VGFLACFVNHSERGGAVQIFNWNYYVHFLGVVYRATGLRHRLSTAFLHLLQASKVRHHLQGTWDLFGHRAVGRKHVCIPAFVLWLLLQVLETSPYRRGAVEIYIWHYYDHLFQVPSAFLRQRSVSSAALVFSLARWCKFHSLYIWCCRSRNLVRRLPFERDTFWNMQIYAYLWLYLFRIVHVFWIARGSVDVVSFCWRIKDVSLYDLQAYGPHTFFTTGFPRFLSIRGARGLQAFDFTSMH
jgi:hypothetical protein